MRDTIALGTLAVLAIALSFVTYLLFHSFSEHRLLLENRWRARGEAALAAGNPQAAIASLHSALTFAPESRDLQIELAQALAAAGRTHQAQLYFTTLLESEPGSGIINLQLARIALQQKDPKAAVTYYQAAIDGTWNGDAFSRRRAIRLELARVLIAQGVYPEARSLLVITAGNSPNDHALQLTVAEMLEQAEDPANAIEIYRKAAKNRSTRLAGLIGGGRASLTLGRLAEAKKMLGSADAESGFAHLPSSRRDAVRSDLKTVDKALALYPFEKLPMAERAKRIAHDAGLAQARLLACPANAAVPSAASMTPPPQRLQLLAALAAHLKNLNPLAQPAPPAAPAPIPATPNPAPSPSPGLSPAPGSKTGSSSKPAAAAPATPPAASTAAPGDTLATLAKRWTALSTGESLLTQLAANPDLAQQTMQLVYQTELATAAACGPPSGDDALLLKIAKAPDQVEAEQ